MSVLIATGLTALLALSVTQIMVQSYKNVSNIEGLMTVMEVMNDFRFAFAKDGTCRSNILAGATHLDTPRFDKATISPTTPATIIVRKILGLTGNSTSTLDPLKVLFEPNRAVPGSNRIKLTGASFQIQNEITENTKYSGSLIFTFDRGAGVVGPQVITRRLAMTFNTTLVSGTTLDINDCRVTADEIPTAEVTCEAMGGNWSGGTCNFATGTTITDTCAAFGGNWNSTTLSCDLTASPTALSNACSSLGGAFDSVSLHCTLPTPSTINPSAACGQLGGSWSGTACDFSGTGTPSLPPPSTPPSNRNCSYNFSENGGPSGTCPHGEVRNFQCVDTGAGDIGTVTYQCIDGSFNLIFRTCRADNSAD